MTFIEGIGDEVTAFFVIVIVIILATLVTFIGSGPHLYSPVHTRSVHIALLSSRGSPEAFTTIQSLDNQRTNDLNGLDTSYEFGTPDLPPTAPHPPGGNETEPESEEEEQSSSEETAQRPPESDQPESEATAPTQETVEDDSSQGGIRVRLKYLDDTERTVRSSALTRVADFKRNHFPEDLANNRVVRLIFCGHLLRDNSTLESYRIVDNSVVHVQVLAAQAQQSRSTVPGQQQDLDLSHLLWPLVSVILGMCWVFYFKYPEFFSVISLSLLFVFTASFFVFYTHVHQ